MPNGGSDCCGTCWFNAKNKGKAGYQHARDPEPDECLIRQLPIPISDPFSTYCANHSHHNPERRRLPIGPVFRDDHRTIWVESPDTEEIRQQLLELLHRIQEPPQDGYPTMSLEEIVIWQVGAFREKQAADDLRRIMAFDTQATSPKLGRTRARAVALAKEALEKIESGQAPLP